MSTKNREEFWTVVIATTAASPMVLALVVTAAMWVAGAIN